MKKVIVLFFCSILFSPIHAKDTTSAVTFQLNGGRFGDNLLSYARAKWISYLHGIPLHLRSFPYADQLMLFEKEYPLHAENFQSVEKLPKSRHLDIKKDSNTLYVNHWYTKVAVDWNDQAFVSELKTLIAPRYDITKVTIPEGYVSVAIHVRTGGGFVADNARERERCPLRFVSEEFYIAQIDRIAQMYPNDNLYVYIFTDHQKPKKLAKKFAAALNNDRIVFDYQKEENSHKLNVLEDFFSMMQFECLIRPGSHFSRFVERLGDAKLAIHPYDYKKKGEENVITVIGVKTRKKDGGWKSKRVKI